MYQSPGSGISKKVATAEATVIATGQYTAGGGVNVIGLMAYATAADATTVRLYHGVTATATGTYNASLGTVEQGSNAVGLLTFPSVARATYMALPAYLSGSAVIVVTGSAGVSLFWNPAA